MIDKIYHAFLWWNGFAYKEHISDMEARQLQRIGIFWYLKHGLWIAVLLCFAVVGIVWGGWWLAGTIPAIIWLGAYVWFIPHIINYAPREETRMFTRRHLWRNR
jgi:hypothetical protein